MNARNYHYADRKFSVGDVYQMLNGNQEEVCAIWIDRKYGDVIRTSQGGDRTPNDFYRQIATKVR